jgi:hypothetical protein
MGMQGESADKRFGHCMDIELPLAIHALAWRYGCYPGCVDAILSANVEGQLNVSKNLIPDCERGVKKGRPSTVTVDCGKEEWNPG